MLLSETDLVHFPLTQKGIFPFASLVKHLPTFLQIKDNILTLVKLRRTHGVYIQIPIRELASGHCLSGIAAAKQKYYRLEQAEQTVAIIMSNYSYDKCFTVSFLFVCRFYLTSVKHLIDRMTGLLCLYFCLQ